MGRRLLYFTPELLVEFLKDSPETPKRLMVTRGLPPDARYAGYEWTGDGRTLAFVLESAAWMGDSLEPLPVPELTVWWGEHQEGVSDVVRG